MADKLSLETLESWLWESANILRGSIDSSDFKNYIFGLLFLKRYNDVFDERVAKLMKDESLSYSDAQEEIEDKWGKFPISARWFDLISRTENIGEALDKAFATIEANNPELQHVLTATQYGDKRVLADATLQRLLRHFNQYKLGNDDLYKADMLGDAYEYLIKQFADDAGKKGGEFYTPKAVVQVVVELIDPQPGHSVYDPTCGSGGMLVESAHHVSALPNGTLMGKPNVLLYGQEKNLGFSNKNRLAALKSDHAVLDKAVHDLGKATQAARSVMDNLEGTAQTWGRIAKTSWALIDVQSAQARMDVLRSDLDALERPDSDLGMAKARWEAASAEHAGIRTQQGEVSRQIGGKESDIRQAKTQIELASEAAQAGLVDVVRESLTTRVGQMHIDDLEMAPEIETRHRSELDETKQKAHGRESKASNRASAIVTRFKTEWPLITNDWMGGIDGLDDYLDHLVHLETEGLPDLVDRFRERLNRNATQSLARISQAIDAEREDIRDRIETINEVLERTEFKHGTFLRLGSRSEIFEHVKAFNSQMIRVLARAGTGEIWIPGG